jgi:hypothetical protein
MKKALSISIIFVCVAIYYCSNNPDIIERYTDYRINRKYLGSDKVGYGGLYGMCYLSEYRIPFYYDNPIRHDSLPRSIDLYIFSDSYLYYSVKRENFAHINKFHKIKWWESNTFMKPKSLDTSKTNILVIEMTERYVREIWSHSDGIFNMLKFDATYTGNTYYVENSLKVENERSVKKTLEKHLFNPNINSNLELNLFDYGIFRPFKELKANFNYYIFNRKTVDVFVDTSKMFLYYLPTVDGEQNMNSFFSIDSIEFRNICQNINKVYDYYKGNGFNEVYLSIIPNPVTLVNPKLKTYNNLIPLINSVDSLRMQIFNVYELFKVNPQKYYSRSDSHWSNYGLQKWLVEFNRILEKKSCRRVVPKTGLDL